MNFSRQVANHQNWPAKRRWTRYAVDLCLKITFQRNGKRQVVYGRSIEVAIGGMSCYVPMDLLLCEKLEVELIFPDQQRTQVVEAVVRNRKGHRYGLEFSSLIPSEPARILESCHMLVQRTTL
jgi:PilZ domain